MTKEYKPKKVELSETTNSQLDEISKSRREDESFIWRKKDIVAKLIADMYKKECK